MPRKKPKKLITLDTETYNGLKGDLKRIAIYDGIDVTYGYKFSDIQFKIDEWFKKGYDLHIYIHNLEFDLRKIPEVLNRKNVKWTKTRLINNKYVIVACKKYTLHDSIKLLPMSLKELSEKVGIANVNLSKLKTGKVNAIRFSTLEAICDVLDCQPGDILEYQREEAEKGIAQ